MAPLISVIIPVYNGAPYLRECLDSLLLQQFEDWEAVCIDDGSTDGSDAILDDYAARDRRFVILRQANAGASAARNNGLAHCSGKYFWFVDADDVLLSGAFEFLSSLLRSYPQIDAWHLSKVHSFVDSAELVPSYGGGVVDVLNEEACAGGFLWMRISGLTMLHVYRSDHYKNCRFVEGMRMLEDQMFLIDALAIPSRWARVDKILYGYRLREGSLSRALDLTNYLENLQSYSRIVRCLKTRLMVSDDSMNRYCKLIRPTVEFYLDMLLADGSRDIRNRGAEAYAALTREVGFHLADVFLRMQILTIDWPCWNVAGKMLSMTHRVYRRIKRWFSSK